MGYIVYFCIGILFQYGMYGEPSSILNGWFIAHVVLRWAFALYHMLVWLFWPTLILIAACVIGYGLWYALIKLKKEPT